MLKVTTALALSTIAVATVASNYSNPNTADHALADPMASGSTGPEIFELAAPGAAKCTVRRGTRRSGPIAELMFDGSCVAVYAELTHAVVWRETDDGTVVFADATGRSIVEFSAADGAGFESIVPAAQLLRLVRVEKSS